MKSFGVIVDQLVHMPMRVRSDMFHPLANIFSYDLPRSKSDLIIIIYA